jgi:hypothetical protein
MEDQVSDSVLAETPARVVRFLGAVARSSRIRTALSTRGYRDEDHQEGWALLHKDAGFPNPKPATNATTTAAAAAAELGAWDEPNFRVIRASLARRFPEQGDYVFEGGLAASAGSAAVLGVATLLGRLESLKSATERKATRKQDLASLAMLAQKGYDDVELTRVKALVDLASQAAPVAAPIISQAERDERRATRLLLRAWFMEWSETARAVITRRQDLIALGLATRRVAPKDPEQEGTDTEVTDGEDASAQSPKKETAQTKPETKPALLVEAKPETTPEVSAAGVTKVEAPKVEPMKVTEKKTEPAKASKATKSPKAKKTESPKAKSKARGAAQAESTKGRSKSSKRDAQGAPAAAAKGAGN